MRVTLLPSSFGPDHHGPQFLSSYLVGDKVVIDGGSIGLQADLELQRRVRHVFLTHAHLDHVASLPFLIENTSTPGRECVEILGSATVLAELRQDLFNGQAWPDFFALSGQQDWFVTATPILPLVAVQRAGLDVTPVPVQHGTSTMAMVVDDGTACVAFAADTGPTDMLWDHLAKRKNLRAVFLECSFPRSLAALATRCGHHAPDTFAAEVARIATGVRVIVVHRKAAYAEVIAAELAAMNLPGVTCAEPGMPYEF
jgi:ribonuclease BN (tRNA processing enzyme)